MSDIFSEVDDDLRRDQFLRLWKRYGVVVYVAAGLIIAGTAIWRGYEYYRTSEANAGAEKYLAALDLANAGKSSEAIAALDALGKSGPSGYGALAKFRAATERQKAGDTQGALALLDDLSNSAATPKLLQEFALVRGAALALDLGDDRGVEARVGRFNDPVSSWRHSARELLGLAAYRAKNWARVREVLEPVDHDMLATQEFRSRAQMLVELASSELGPRDEAPASGDTPK